MSEKNYFSGKIQDLIRREQRGEGMVFSAFLTAEEAEEAELICRKSGSPYLFYGGYENAERKMLAVSSMDADALRLCYPIALISVDAFEPENISNRDVLGALMSAGIRRECLGDIVAREGVVLFFALDQIADFLIENVDSIGRQSVSLKRQYGDFRIPSPRFEEQRDTVASLRLDAVVASLMHASREQACRMIELSNVSVDHKPVDKKTKEVAAGMKIVIRGRGKWVIDECDSITKKGRIVIKTRKYI